MAAQSDRHFRFTGKEGTTLDVVRFELSEGLSRPFRLELELSSSDGNLVLETLLDSDATFTIERDGEPVRTVHGIVTMFEQGETGFRRTRYRMKRSITYALLLTAISADSWSSEVLATKGSSIVPYIPDTMVVRPTTKGAMGLPETECLEFLSKKLHREVGFMCITKWPQLLEDYGIDARAVASRKLRPNVATGMAIYPMAKFNAATFKAFTADVDCDDGSDPQYRATATCNITVAKLSNDVFLLSNFILIDHAKRVELAKKVEVEIVWNRSTYKVGTPPRARSK